VARPLLIIKTGSTVPTVRARRGDFERWFAAAMQLQTDDLDVVDVTQNEALPSPASVSGVIVTGSPAMVTERADWSVQTGHWLKDAVQAQATILGVCYGHQLLADALGGDVHDNPLGRNIGTVDVRPTDAAEDDPLLGEFGSLHVPVSHMQSVKSLPPDASLLATTALDPHHAFRVGDRCWGIQFHPEFDADIVRGYIDARQAQLQAEGLDARALRQQARDTDDGPRLLQRFRDIALEGR
jgi:GMP synthase (glutamine-hydrolysing)